MRPSRAIGCLHKSRKEGTKEKVGRPGGARGLLRPRGGTDPGQLHVKVPAQEIQAQDPFRHLPNVCLRTGSHWMERLLPWGDVFCLRKTCKLGITSRGGRNERQQQKHTSWRGLDNKQRLTTRCHVHAGLPKPSVTKRGICWRGACAASPRRPAPRRRCLCATEVERKGTAFGSALGWVHLAPPPAGPTGVWSSELLCALAWASPGHISGLLEREPSRARPLG